MRVVIFGTSAAFASKDECCSSYLITAGGKNYVIDTGSGSFLHFTFFSRTIHELLTFERVKGDQQ